jgi:glycosyltransferase involved in cell wall biosynthesis
MRAALHVGQLLQPIPGGIGRYVRHLLDALPATGVDVIPFAAGAAPGPLAGYVDLGPPTGAARYELWHRLRQPVVRVDAEVVHAPSLAVPPTGRCPLVVTVHDLVFLHQPEHLTRRGVSFHRRGLHLARRSAAAFVVPSAFVADELADVGVDRERIHVAHHGVDAPATARADVDATLARLGVRPPFVLFVGTVEPRKGVADLLDAHAALRREHPDLGLVVVGQQGWGDPPDLDRPGVVVAGRAGDDDLDALYRTATVFALPSSYEGFGMPVVEAMARGCPVVTTTAGALPEVCDGAATLVAPGDTDALADALAGLVDDADRRRAADDAGRARASAFTWAASAEAHAAAYRAAAGSPG